MSYVWGIVIGVIVTIIAFGTYGLKLLNRFLNNK